MTKVLRDMSCFYRNSSFRLWIRQITTKPSYYHCLGEEPLSPLTIGQLSEQTVNRYGDSVAIIACDQHKQMTFSEVLDEADRLAAGFLKLGFNKGDKIGLWAPNLIEWYVSFVACARGGYIAVTMNPYYQPAEVRNLIKKVRMKGLICGNIFRKQNYYNLMTEVCPELSQNKPGKIYSDKIPTLRNVIRIAEDDKKGTYKYSDILNIADEDSITQIKQNQHMIQFDDSCNIQFTSGTTGSPKAPVQSHFSLVNNGYYCGKRIGLHEKHHRICLQNPFFHVFGTVISIVASLNHGSTIVLPNDGYDPDKNLTAIAKEKCTVIFGTPTMFVDLIERQRQRNEIFNAEIALSGGAPCSAKLFKDMLNILKVKEVKSVYGLTETTASSFFSHSNSTEYQTLNTVGKLHEHLEAKVVDDNGNIVPAGKPGELHIRGYCNMLGYYDDDVKTKELIDRNGWLKTGDQFILTEDGYGEVVGRIKDMIIRGGENIYPSEIEEFLITYPDIIEVQVIGIPHDRLGEEVCAVIKSRNNCPITPAQLFEFCKGKLSNFKIPTVVEIVQDFPTTTSGKIQKNKIIDILLRK